MCFKTDNRTEFTAMITLHFYPQPQYVCEFHIYFTSFHCTGRYELAPNVWLSAQLVEHRTGIAEVTGSKPVEALIFYRLLPSMAMSSVEHAHSGREI